MLFILGVLCIAYGCYTLFLRFSNPDKFGKLKAMQERFGASAGSLLHLVSYTLMPILVGVVLIVAAQRGVTLEQFLSN